MATANDITIQQQATRSILMKQTTFCTNAASLMQAHSRAIVHLRSQNDTDRKRVGLIIGAGVSRGIKNPDSEGSLPDWSTLIQRIATNTKIKGEKELFRLGVVKKSDGSFDYSNAKKPLSSLAQLIFQLFKLKYTKKRRLKIPLTLINERKLNTEWMKIVHEGLYSEFDCEASYQEAINSHPYLSQLVDLIKNIPLTVNFNFDDSIERLLFIGRNENEAMRTRGFEVILEPYPQMGRDRAVVYHPNGALLFLFEDGASPELVFSDDAFHDQISSIASGRNVLLTNYLFSNTCILLGLSLEDISLQHTLRQNAVSHPGHPHYIVHYMRSEDEIPQDVRNSIFRSNFDTFGVYTFFLNDQGIASLFDLISKGKDSFKRNFAGFAEDQVKFVYYLIGAVGVGKSTAVRYFQSLRTYDEWVDRRLPEMSRPDDELQPEERKRVDQWVVRQFGKKNFCIAGAGEYIHIIDRCPLDPLTFGGEAERAQKAVNLCEEMTKGGVKVQEGQLLWLDCGVEEIAHRKSRKHKNWPKNKIAKLLKGIGDVYNDLPSVRVPTRGRTAVEVARELSWIIFVGEYTPADIGSSLQKYAEEK